MPPMPAGLRLELRPALPQHSSRVHSFFPPATGVCDLTIGPKALACELTAPTKTSQVGFLNQSGPSTKLPSTSGTIGRLVLRLPIGPQPEAATANCKGPHS